ncbi:TonB-dependent receptor [Xanthocytophaga flava]|uniref:TonB-dependent receptor n=1 Tax=Xanthocytophaga flava TaxID=3048013 RepID=UPI0028D8A0CA|nr:TonB-dependent receptor [Xanthocytophaga flavus]MDJ1471577.1 TonB-dependent receptor [Xanthocytophaga flavus]
MKFSVCTILLLLLCFTTLSYSQSRQIHPLKGIVMDQMTREYVSNATITLTTKANTSSGEPDPKAFSKMTKTNELGQFTFLNIPDGSYTLSVSYVGFVSQSLNISVPSTIHNQPLSIALQAAPVQLSEVTVSSIHAHDQQIISSLDIKLRPITNSQEILRMVPGLFIGQHAGGGKAEQIFLRGFDLDHGTDIRLTVDGMPVNMVSHAHGQGYADLHFVIPELVENVDFKKGPYHTAKGNFTTAGWVDFHTQNVLEKSLVKLEVGQYNTYRAVGAFNMLGQKMRQQGHSAYLASEYSYSDSYFDNPQHFKRFNLLGKYQGKLSEATQLLVTASTFYSKWNHSGQIPDRAVASGLIDFYGSIDPTEGGETSRTNVNAEFTTATPGGSLIKNQFFYSNYNFELYSNFTFFLKDTVNGDQIRQKEGRNLFGYNGSFQKTYYLGSTQWISTLGASYRQDLTQNSELSHTKNRTETLERLQYGDVNELNAGLYIDELVHISPKWTVNAGVRIDYFRDQYTDLLQNPVTTKQANGTIVSPKLNFYYTPNSRFQFYLNTGKGFHSNDTRVVVPQNGKQILPAAYGSDLGMIVKPFPKLLINAALWYLWLDQEFVYVGDEGVIEPSGKSRRQGIDVSVRYQLTRSLYADVDLNTARPRAIGELAGQNYLPLAPTFTTTGGLSLTGQKGFSGSLRYRYMGNRPANEDNSIVAKGYFVTDLQANYTKPTYAVGLSVQNLFNTRWKETQFATESRLKGEATSVDEIHFTPGTPFFARLSLTYFLK